MRSKIVNQIHDSILCDSHKDEVWDIIAKVKKIVEVDLPKAWRWIIVPLKIEAELSPLGASWYDKKPVEI